MKVRGARFLITGGFGLVGSHIADRLLEAGAGEVILLDNGGVGSADMVGHLKGRVRLVNADILRLEDVVEAVQGVDGVFHTAAFITLPLAQRPLLGLDVNIRGFLNVLEACRIRAVKKLIYTSSIAAYGHVPDGVISETSPFVSVGVQPPSALYGLSKLVAEQCCALYAQRYGLEWVALRCSTVYGERQHARGLNVVPILEAYDRAMQGLAPVIPGDGKDVHDYIFADDVARAHVLAMEAAVSGEAVTIATGRPVSLNDVVGIVLKQCRSTLTPEHRERPGRVKSAGATAKHYSIDKAAALLGFTPQVTLEQGIARLIAWRAKTRDCKPGQA